MFAMTLAAADPVGALLGSGTFKSLGTMILIGIAALALFYPSLLAKIKAGVAAMIAEQLHITLPTIVENRIKLLGNDTLPTSDPSALKATQPLVNVSDIVKQRAAALKIACPKSDAAIRLKWLELGYDSESAKTDYIATLENQVVAANTKAPEAA